MLVSLQIVAIASLIYVTAVAVYRLYLHPLAKFPGPKLAALSRWYEAYFDLVQNGQYTNKIEQFHRKYGPIVRISPYELHILDADYYEKLFQQEGRWNKYDWSYDAFDVPNATICTLDHYHHRQRRAPISPYFSKAAILTRQDLILHHVDKFQSRIKQFLGMQMDLGSAISAVTADIANEIVLGRSLNGLDKEDFNKHMTNMLQGAGAIWRTTKHFPFFSRSLKKIPESWLEKLGDPNMNAFMSYLRIVRIRVAELNSNHDPGKTSSTPRNLVHTILDSSLPAHEKLLHRISDDLETITGAGFETTAQTLRGLVFYIYSNPKILARLRSELKDHTPPSIGQYSWADLERLPYLSAVIMEALRLIPGVVSRTARIAPDRELVYGEYIIPRGTPVSSTVMLMHLDEKNYTDPLTFNPDRWIDTGKKENTRAFAPFSRGSRMCLGMNLAWAELYVITAVLVSTFDFDLCGTRIEDVQYYSDQFIMGPKSKNGVKVIPTLC